MKTGPVSIVGLGYVGISTAVCLAHRGLTVYGVDVDREKLASIERGEVPFHEKGLDRMLKASMKKGRLHCASDYKEAVQKTTVTFLTVGTPSGPDGSINLGYVESAAKSIGRVLATKERFHIVVVKSTVVPGTSEGPVRQALESSSGKRCGRGFGLVVNPEFLREGSAVQDTLHPDGIVIGTNDERSRRVIVSLWRRFYGELPTTFITTPANAELVKYAANGFRATQLSFLNTMANLCQNIPGADMTEVVKGFSSVTRVDPRYLKAGLGFGGSCLPKDLRALIAHYRRVGSNPEFFEEVLRANERQPLQAVELTRKLVGGELRGMKIAVLGLAFKANTDDIRESVAIILVERLLREGASVTAYDPKAMDNARKVFGDRVKFAKDAWDCISDAECCIVATDWDEFRKIKPKELKELMSKPIVVDGRRVLDLQLLKDNGVTCIAIGKGEEGLATLATQQRHGLERHNGTSP